MYVRFFRWATDRIQNEGIIAFVSNSSFVDGRTFDGFRKLAAQEFNDIYIINLKGNARTSGERRRQEGGNFFSDDIRVGIAIYFFVKKKSVEKCKIYYNEIRDYAKADEKKVYLSQHKIETLDFDHIIPDKNYNWIKQSDENWDELLPLIDKEAKAGKSEKCIFKLFSRGIGTYRDEWMYDRSMENIVKKIKYFTTTYQATLRDKTYLDKFKIKWDADLETYLLRGIEKIFEEEKIISASFRPFYKLKFYFDKHFNGRTYQWFDMFKNNQSNQYFSINSPGNPKEFYILASNTIIDRPSPCVGQRLFCDDFEDTTKKVGARWDTVREEVGTFDLDPTEVVSGERALRLRLAPGSGTRSSDLAKAIDLPSPNVRVTFDLSLDLAQDITSQLLELLFVEPQPYPSGVNFQAFEIIVGGPGPRLEAYRSFTDGGDSVDSVSVTLASRRYVPGVMELRHAQGNLSAQLSLDGQVVGTRTFATPAPTRVLLRIGAPYTRSVTTPGTVRVDDVFVEAL